MKRHRETRWGVLVPVTHIDGEPPVLELMYAFGHDAVDALALASQWTGRPMSYLKREGYRAVPVTMTWRVPSTKAKR